MLEFTLLLARELKYTHRDLLEAMGDGELELWYELHKRQPLGNEWYQTALTCSTIANFCAWGLKRPTTPEDFLPHIVERRTPEQLHQQFLMVLAGMGKIPEPLQVT